MRFSLRLNGVYGYSESMLELQSLRLVWTASNWNSDPGLQPAWLDLNSSLQQMKFLAVKTTVRPLCCLSVASEEGRLIFITPLRMWRHQIRPQTGSWTSKQTTPQCTVHGTWWKQRLWAGCVKNGRFNEDSQGIQGATLSTTPSLSSQKEPAGSVALNHTMHAHSVWRWNIVIIRFNRIMDKIAMRTVVGKQ